MAQDVLQQLLQSVDPETKVVAKHMLGLSLGAAVAILAPVFSFLIFRRWFHIRARFVLFGVIATAGSYSVLSFIFPILWSAVGFVAEAMVPRGARLTGFFISFKGVFTNAAVSELFQLTIQLIILALLTHSDRSGRSALAFGIGSNGWICWLRAQGLVQHFMLARSVNNAGIEATFGKGVTVSPSNFANMFTLGLPSGVSDVAQFVLSLALILIAWNGWVSHRWGRIAFAYAIAICVVLGMALIQASADLWWPTNFLGDWSSVGVVQSYHLALGVVTVIALYRYRRFFVEAISAEASTRDNSKKSAVEVDGVFATWRKQVH